MLTHQLLQADLELVEAQARLDRLRAEPAGPAPADPSGPDAEMVAAFYATPQVAEVRARLDKAREGLAQADRIARDAERPGPDGLEEAGRRASRRSSTPSGPG